MGGGRFLMGLVSQLAAGAPKVELVYIWVSLFMSNKVVAAKRRLRRERERGMQNPQRITRAARKLRRAKREARKWV
jgi:hypothetical protein